MEPIYIVGIAMTEFGRHPDRSLQDMAREVLQLARKGLKSRSFGEEPFLYVLDEEVQSGHTQADKLLELYHSAWKGKINPVFEAAAF